MDPRLVRGAEMIGGHHPPERRYEAPLRIGEEGCYARERLLLLGIEDMENRADKERMTGLLPMVAPLKRAFGIDKDIGDVLDVPDFISAATDLKQRIVARRARIGRIEKQAMREARTPARSQLPVLTLDVMDDGRARPG